MEAAERKGGGPMSDRDALHEVLAYAERFMDELPERPVAPPATLEELRAGLGGPLPESGIDGATVTADLIKVGERGVLATAGPRFFGFVIGGAMPTTVAADWLVSTWDQNAGLYVSSPTVSVLEEVAGGWLKELLGLPAESSAAFVTGGQMANWTGLAAARDHVLRQHGWDVEAKGLQGAPQVTVIAAQERHITVDVALRYLGLGTECTRLVPCDDQARMLLEPLHDLLNQASGPTIVCVQAGNVNTGAFDRIGEICEMAHEVGAWVHVDGAFGLWAAASHELEHLLQGHDAADSWAVDAHKWLNVPYDSGLAFTAHPEAHLAATSAHASYLIVGENREPLDWTPEFSRRARSVPVYAAIRALGRSGIAEMIERACSNARRFADQLGDRPGVEVLNDVVLNQVLVRFGDDDAKTNDVIRKVQEDGTLWLSGSTYGGRAVMRISVSNWATTAEDVDRSVEAILGAAS
jgi:glutamate/tyrosine decarboxylase-like PLP-dependent enzyme